MLKLFKCVLLKEIHILKALGIGNTETHPPVFPSTQLSGGGGHENKPKTAQPKHFFLRKLKPQGHLHMLSSAEEVWLNPSWLLTCNLQMFQFGNHIHL